jgi:pimeloyl-ACP methyl ester carboxylesterase
MSVVILQDSIVHYEVLGRGRPLIFLHGWVGSWRYWFPTMQAASISFRAYAIDLWGFGDTDKQPSNYTLENQSKLLDNFLDKLGIGKIALIGHGLGAAAALDFTARNPQMVDRVMAVSFPLETSEINPRLQEAAPSELAEWLLGRAAGTEAARMEAVKADERAVAASLEDIQDLERASFLKRLQTPCLLVHGQYDDAVTIPAMEEIGNLAEHIHHVTFEQSAHFPMLEENNKFNRLLTDFLSLASGESPKQLQLKEEWRRRVR